MRCEEAYVPEERIATLTHQVEWAAVAMAASRSANPVYMVLSDTCHRLRMQVVNKFKTVPNRDLVLARLLAIRASQEADDGIRDACRTRGGDPEIDAAMSRSCDIESALDDISYMGC